MDFLMDIWLGAVISLVVGVMVAASTWFVTTRVAQLQEARNALRTEKRKIYLELLEPWIRVWAIVGSSSNEKQKTRDLQASIKKDVRSFEGRKKQFEFKLVGSDTTIRAYNALLRAGWDDSNDQSLEMLARLLLAIRNDLGPGKSDLEPHELIQSFINEDAKEFISKKGNDETS